MNFFFLLSLALAAPMLSVKPPSVGNLRSVARVVTATPRNVVAKVAKPAAANVAKPIESVEKLSGDVKVFKALVDAQAQIRAVEKILANPVAKPAPIPPKFE